MVRILAVIGLGNPGHQFIKTRHNIGFRVVDALAKHYNASFKKQGIMDSAEVHVNTTPIFLVKPLTFMNNSGAVYDILKKKNIKPENILVVHDELEKPLCTVTIKEKGSHRGHNGLRSLIAHTGTDQFLRLGFGVDRPTSREPEVVGAYVLSSFTKTEEENIESCMPKIIDKIIELLEKK